MKYIVRYCILTFVITGALTAASAAQLTGRVTDQAGNGLLARLTIIQPDTRDSTVAFTTPDGRFTTDVPDGNLGVLATHGPEWSIAETTARAGQELNLALRRLVDMPARGYYCADLHMHSIFSDGKQPPPAVALACQAEGLRIAALTDHDTVQQQQSWLQQQRPDFLPLRGEEITTKLGHILGINISQRVPPDVSNGAEDMRRIFREVHEQGGFAIVAHPNVPGMPYQTPQIMDYDGLEILNGSVPPYGPICDFVQGRKAWQALLSQGRHVAVVGDSDKHDVTGGLARRILRDPQAVAQADQRIGVLIKLVDFHKVIEPWGWKGLHNGFYRTYLQLEECTPQAVEAAVKAGRGFVTNGPLILATLGGKPPGSEVTLGDRSQLTFSAELVANRPLERLVLVINGQPAITMQSNAARVQVTVPVKKGDWVTTEVYGPWPEFATTNAWYVE